MKVEVPEKAFCFDGVFYNYISIGTMHYDAFFFPPHFNTILFLFGIVRESINLD